MPLYLKILYKNDIQNVKIIYNTGCTSPKIPEKWKKHSEMP